MNRAETTPSGAGNRRCRVIAWVVLLGVAIVLVGVALNRDWRSGASPPASPGTTQTLPPVMALSPVVESPARPPMNSYASLKPVLARTLTHEVKGHFSVFLEDITTGAWLGIDEDTTYPAWSLLKVAVMVTVLKKIEQGILSPDQTVVINQRELDVYSFLPAEYAAGDRIPIKDLMVRCVAFSDNTASLALAGLFTFNEFQQTLQALGLPPSPLHNSKHELPRVSPRQYANLLHALYVSGYLNRASSDWVLSVMSATVYDSQLRAGVPSDIRLAHMVGFNAACGEFHDCGIVYFPGHPYLICVMSTGSTREEADQVISNLSRQVYAYYRDRQSPR